MSVKPDVELGEETGKIYFGGKVYDLAHYPDGWALRHINTIGNLFIAGTVDELCDWLCILR